MNAPLDLTRTRDDYADLALDCLRPAQGGDLWDWCSNNLVLESGKRWDPRRARLMRHWYNVASARLNRRPDPRDPYAHLCEQIWLSIAAQLAKSTFSRAVLGFSMACAPRISAYYRARLADLKNDRDRKLWPMISKTDPLRRLLPAGAAALKSAIGANSWALGTSLTYWRSGAIADDLRSDAIELALPDEFDTYPADVEGYGDPLDQIIARQRTLRKTRLAVGTTTPGTVAGHGWSRVCGGSHERPLIDCPHCGAAQDLTRRGLALVDCRKLTDVRAAEILKAKLARYVCQVNGCLITSEELNSAIVVMLDGNRPWCAGEWTQDKQTPNGRWKHHADIDGHGRLKAIPPPQTLIRTGQACALYSLDETLDTFTAKEAAAQQGKLTQLKTHTNNEGAEPFIIHISDTDTDQLLRSAQPAEPYRIGLLDRPGNYRIAIFFDQQGNTRGKFWYPYVVRAFHPGVGSWLIDEGVAKNDDEAEALEERTWQIGGEHRRADRVGRDSANGNARFDAYLWAAKKSSVRLLLRGDAGLAPGIPWLEVVDNPKTRRRTPKPSGVKEYRIAAHYWRDELWDQMRGIERPVTTESDAAPEVADRPRWYLPADVSDRYKNSLTSEEQVVEKRMIERVWRDAVVWRPRVITTTADKQTYRDDNHWWDSEADILAMANILGWDKAEIILDLPSANTSNNYPPGGFMDGFT